MNVENFKVWIAALRGTTIPQVKSILIDVTHRIDADDEVCGACCLGIGQMKVPDINILEYADTILPDDKFAEWLGIDPRDKSVWTQDPNEGQPRIGWPDAGEDHDSFYRDRDGNRYAEDLGAPSSLNDDLGLTFPQIADLLAYFGIRGCPESWAK